MKGAGLAIILLALFAGCDSRSKAPDFTLPSVEDKNEQITLSAFTTEHPVLLVFWATWCPSCVLEIPTLNEWHDKYSARGLKILAIDVQEPADQALNFMKENPLRYLSVTDENGEVASRYGLAGLPSSLFLAKGGKILYYGFGLPENMEQLLAQN
ncbi:MAG TPA: TlpA disulfide reductase family protein [bacterium]|nr:TlpA disulfide reductase family protein [bacterium]